MNTSKVREHGWETRVPEFPDKLVKAGDISSGRQIEARASEPSVRIRDPSEGSPLGVNPRLEAAPRVSAGSTEVPRVDWLLDNDRVALAGQHFDIPRHIEVGDLA